MKYSYTIAFSASLLLATAAFSVAETVEGIPDDTVITLQRKGCEKRCAVYKVVIFADGTVIYDGQYFVRKEGIVRSKIEPQKLKELIAAFDAAKYFELASRYGFDDRDKCTSTVADAPIAMTAIVSGGRSKGVVHHHRCAGPVPDRLTDLEDKIDKAVGTRRWIK